MIAEVMEMNAPLNSTYHSLSIKNIQFASLLSSRYRNKKTVSYVQK